MLRAEEDSDHKLQGGDLAGVISDFSKAIEIDPGNERAWICRGNAFATNSQLDEGLADLTDSHQRI